MWVLNLRLEIASSKRSAIHSSGLLLIKEQTTETNATNYQLDLSVEQSHVITQQLDRGARKSRGKGVTDVSGKVYGLQYVNP